MNKKGQITVFIGIAIVMLIAVGAVIYFMQKEVAPEHIRRLLVDVPEMAKPIAAYIYSCLDDAIPVSVNTIAQSGGYIFPHNFVESEYGDISYGFRKGENTLVSIAEMQDQLSGLIGGSIIECFDVAVIEKQGYKITTSEIIANTQILPDKVISTIKFPVIITKGDSSITIENFALDKPLPLGKLHGIAGMVVTELKKNQEGINIGGFQDLDAQVEVVPIDEENLMFAIRSIRTVIGKNPLTFIFAAEIELNKPPVFTNLPDEFTLPEEEPFSYTITAEDPNNDPFTFFAEAGLFGIDENTGYFEFTPKIPGEFDVMFEVKDFHGATYRKQVTFIIEES